MNQEDVVEFRGVQLLKNEAIVLSRIEEENGLELKYHESHIIGVGFRVKNKHVVELKISSYREPLISCLDDEIALITHIEKLDLANNELENLPETICALSRLEELNLKNNRLTKLPDSIYNLQNLKKLDLCNNRLRAIPEEFYKLSKLSELNLGGNNLEHLPIGFWKLPCVERLNLSNNGLCELAGEIIHWKGLKSLDISGNNTIKLPDVLPELFDRPDFYGRLPNSARRIPPMLLFIKDMRTKNEAFQCFESSVNILDNPDEFLDCWLSGEERIYPHLLKLGERLRYISHRSRSRRPTAERERSRALMEHVDAIRNKSVLRIQFINFNESSGSITYPMGLLYITGYLKANGFTNIRYTDYLCVQRDDSGSGGMRFSYESPLEENRINLRNIFLHLDAFNPHLIFLGPITTMYLLDLIALVPQLRRRYPQAIILAGGPHFGKDMEMDRELLMNYCDGIDGMIVGEAEDTVLDICERFYELLKDEKALLATTGLTESTLKTGGLLTRGGTFTPREVMNLDKLPFPDMEILEEYRKNRAESHHYSYSLSHRRNPIVDTEWGTVEAFDGKGDGITSDDIYFFDGYMHTGSEFPFGIIIGSRSCPYNCTFCNSSGVRRVHPAQHVFDQMRHMNERFGIRLFVFFDPLFTSASPKEQRRIEELSGLILAEGLDIKYMIDIRADVIMQLDPQLLLNMISSGCTIFNLGLEKGSDKCLEKMMKGITIQDHVDAIAKLREAAMKVDKRVLINGTFVLGGPDENREDVMDTLAHGLSLDLDGMIFFPLEIHPGTELHELALKEEVIRRGLKLYLDSRHYPIYSSKGLSSIDLKKIADLSGRVVSRLEDIKNIVWKLQRQLGDSSYVPPSEIKTDESDGLNQYIRDFIAQAAEYLREHPGERLVVETEVVLPLRICAEAVKEEILRLEGVWESRTKGKDLGMNAYQLGALMREWNDFVEQLNNLFGFKRHY